MCFFVTPSCPVMINIALVICVYVHLWACVSWRILLGMQYKYYEFLDQVHYVNTSTSCGTVPTFSISAVGWRKAALFVGNSVHEHDTIYTHK